jgi:hypothetical protein
MGERQARSVPGTQGASAFGPAVLVGTRGAARERAAVPLRRDRRRRAEAERVEARAISPLPRGGGAGARAETPARPLRRLGSTPSSVRRALSGAAPPPAAATAPGPRGAVLRIAPPCGPGRAQICRKICKVSILFRLGGRGELCGGHLLPGASRRRARSGEGKHDRGGDPTGGPASAICRASSRSGGTLPATLD